MNTDQGYEQGIVFCKSTGHYTVHAGERKYACDISTLLRKELIYPTADPTSLAHKVQAVRVIEGVDPLAIGDEVRFLVTGPGSGKIMEILPRRNAFSRPASMAGARVLEQVIVSNVDQVIPIFSVTSPTPKWPLLDRYLVSAEAAGIPAIICLTKIDLAQPAPEIEAALKNYQAIGYPVIRVSAVTGEGMAALMHILNARLSVFVGKSGVGKSTLLNAIEPGLGLRVSEVGKGKLGKGKHTTTHLEMFPLQQGGAVVDTPGMREFGLWHVGQDDLAGYFPEMRPWVGKCRFGLDCRHDSEPGCVVRKAVMDGSISPHRYQSFLHLQEEL